MEKMKLNINIVIVLICVLMFLSGIARAALAIIKPTSGSWDQILPASERFVLVMNGEGVLDKETGLVWENTSDTALRTWTSAIRHCYSHEVGGRKGWHLPTIEQLSSLVDSTQSNPALPSGHPFNNVQSSPYWSITTDVDDTNGVWGVNFYNGLMSFNDKVSSYYAWCVRGGESHDYY